MNLKALLSSIVFVFALSSCERWKDKPAVNLGLTNLYCNDPNAVNYNWNFPGKPDNTVCFYPSDLFAGVDSFFIDSIFQQDLSYTKRDSFMLSLVKLTNTSLLMSGFCDSNRSLSWTLTAAKTYLASVDTVLGGIGPAFCRGRDSIMGDTLTGTISRDMYVLTDTHDTGSARVDTFLLHINFTVNSDTGITLHRGTAHIRVKH